MPDQQHHERHHWIPQPPVPNQPLKVRCPCGVTRKATIREADDE